MGHEKPDMRGQSEGFDRVHRSLTVDLIATRRRGDPGIRTCRLKDSVTQVAASNIPTAYDYLPVEDTDGAIVGWFAAKSHTNPAAEDRRLLVRERMCPLSEADLIGADATILDFIRRVRPKPCLVVSRNRIEGLVAWSDLQKLPVRAAVFALITGFELTMSEAIRLRFPSDDGWKKLLSPGRRCKTDSQYQERVAQDSDVDPLLCTQFCDKRTILEKVLSFDYEAKDRRAMPMSRRRFGSAVKRIEYLRNLVAHANIYAMSWAKVEEFKQIVETLISLRKDIKDLDRRFSESGDGD